MSTATWLDPVIQPRRTFNALDFMAGNGSDETGGMRALFAARAAFPQDAAIYFPAPPVRYHAVSNAPQTTGSIVVETIPSGTVIYGDGAASVIRWTGVTKAGTVGASQILWQLKSVSRILVHDLWIEGDNADPYVRYVSNQSCAIAIRKASVTPSDILVRDVTFRNLVGFPYQSSNFIPERCHALRCTVTECANGINVNADYSIQYRNILTDAESIEYAGIPGVIALNDVTAGYVVVGGFNSENTERPGCIAVGNSISDTLDGNTGLLTQESYTDGWLQGNVVEDSFDDGIIVAGLGNTGDFLFDRCTVVNNYVSGANRGIGLQKGEDHMVADNEFGGDLLSGFVQAAAVTPVVRHNTFHGGFLLNTSTAGVTFASNTFASGSLSNQGGTVTTTDSRSGTEQKLYGDVTEGFATLQVRNWDDNDAVDVDLSDSGLDEGDILAIYHPYNLLGQPYASGIYKDGAISLVMREVEPPSDWAVTTTQALPTLGPRFNAFVVAKTTKLWLTLAHGYLAQHSWPDPLEVSASDGLITYATVPDDTTAGIGLGSKLRVVDLDTGAHVYGCEWDGNEERLSFEPGSSTRFALFVTPRPRVPRLHRRPAFIR